MVEKIETCTFQVNIRENRFLLLTGGDAACRHNNNQLEILIDFIHVVIGVR